MLLLSDFDERGFKFYTSSKSQKGIDLDVNPYASMCFYWESLLRQVRVTGEVHKVSEEEMLMDFSRQPIESQLSLYVSNQSGVVKDKEVNLDLRNWIFH
jgi:pyridoxine/pyridoxamine 5'-phosphate oxidase